jgi:hypothetical protein
VSLKFQIFLFFILPFKAYNHLIADNQAHKASTVKIVFGITQSETLLHVLINRYLASLASEVRGAIACIVPADAIVIARLIAVKEKIPKTLL